MNEPNSYLACNYECQECGVHAGHGGIMTDRPLDPWHFIDKFPSDCSAEVTRGGNSQPCDKPAYAVAIGEMGLHWPVCIHHARGRQLIPLRAVLAHGMERMVSFARSGDASV